MARGYAISPLMLGNLWGSSDSGSGCWIWISRCALVVHSPRPATYNPLPQWGRELLSVGLTGFGQGRPPVVTARRRPGTARLHRELPTRLALHAGVWRSSTPTGVSFNGRRVPGANRSTDCAPEGLPCGRPRGLGPRRHGRTGPVRQRLGLPVPAVADRRDQLGITVKKTRPRRPQTKGKNASTALQRRAGRRRPPTRWPSPSG